MTPLRHARHPQRIFTAERVLIGLKKTEAWFFRGSIRRISCQRPGSACWAHPDFLEILPIYKLLFANRPSTGRGRVSDCLQELPRRENN